MRSLPEVRAILTELSEVHVLLKEGYSDSISLSSVSDLDYWDTTKKLKKNIAVLLNQDRQVTLLSSHAIAELRSGERDPTFEDFHKEAVSNLNHAIRILATVWPAVTIKVIESKQIYEVSFYEPPPIRLVFSLARSEKT